MVPLQDAVESSCRQLYDSFMEVVLQMIQQLDLRVEHVFLSPDQVLDNADTQRVKYVWVGAEMFIASRFRSLWVYVHVSRVALQTGRAEGLRPSI